ncbi:MAG: dockerin type I repeat-containing protein [Muribaculaceae bacterium]|nr:dockerin type I repeat-containing protein [Muribaculaceae bacterium]
MRRLSFIFILTALAVALSATASSVSPIASAGGLSVVITAEEAIDGVIYNSHACFRADATNTSTTTEFNEPVIAQLFLAAKDEQGQVTVGDMVAESQSEFRLGPGEAASFRFDFDNLAFGRTYAMTLCGRDENGELVNLVEPGYMVSCDIRRGLVVWTSPGPGVGVPASGNIAIPDEALAARLEGLDITQVKPNANPNTIYLIGANEPVPPGLENCNVVCGDHAGSIALRDGFPYYTPQCFTAAEATYERTFARSRRPSENTAWSTIVLPFTPEAITANGKTLTLCDADDSDSGQLWVECLAGDNNGLPTFECVTAMEANVPYLIAAARTAKNKLITWRAANVQLQPEPETEISGDIYLMAGVYVPVRLHGIFVGEGSYATLMRSSVVQPFRAYFKVIGEGAKTQGQFDFPGDCWMPAGGDVNFDGEVDIEDVNALINIILDYAIADEYTGIAGDVNFDGIIDIDDVNALINILLQ